MLYGRGQQSWLQMLNALNNRQTFLHSTGRDCFRLHRNHRSCLTHSFFFTFLPLFALVGGGALGMLVSYTEMRTVKPFSHLRMVFLTIFVLFAKLKAQFLDSLTKNLQENANLCIQKSYWFCARALFQKFLSPHTNSSGGKGLNVKSTSQILRVYLTGNEKRVREAQH